jgi:hypothetical protein
VEGKVEKSERPEMGMEKSISGISWVSVSNVSRALESYSEKV